MKTLTLITLLTSFLQLSAEEPSIILDREENSLLSLGQEINLTLKVTLVSEPVDTQVKLLPLELENFNLVSITSETEKFGNQSRPTILRRFEIRLSAVESGNAVVGEFQVELNKPAENDGEVLTSLLTHPGFSMEVMRPINWSEAGLWGLLIIAIIVVLAFAFLRLKQSRNLKRLEGGTDRERHRSRVLEDIGQLMMRAEWKKTVDLAFTELLNEVVPESESGQSTGGIIAESTMLDLAEKWTEFPAAYRLGEEVRYGGYSPVKKEASFMVKVLRNIHSELNNNEEGKTEEKE